MSDNNSNNDEVDFVSVNRRLWDDKVPYHVASSMYNLPGFLTGTSSLNQIELDLSGWSSRQTRPSPSMSLRSRFSFSGSTRCCPCHRRGSLSLRHQQSSRTSRNTRPERINTIHLLQHLRSRRTFTRGRIRYCIHVVRRGRLVAGSPTLGCIDFSLFETERTVRYGGIPSDALDVQRRIHTYWRIVFRSREDYCSLPRHVCRSSSADLQF